MAGVSAGRGCGPPGRGKGGSEAVECARRGMSETVAAKVRGGKQGRVRTSKTSLWRLESTRVALHALGGRKGGTRDLLCSLPGANF